MSIAYFHDQAITGPMGPQGPDGNPLGTIISYLGNKPPTGYLVCDGKEYQIADHSQLAAFFEKEFGSKNHFGGDGTSTFAVPDFRNLFLRGFHGESEERLSGEIGAKQEGTEHYNIIPTNDGWRASRRFGVDDIESPVPNADKMIGGLVLASSTMMNNTAVKVYDSYTSRPVNAAVQYCIKATKSFEEDPPQGNISVGVFYNSKTAKVVVPASGWSANAPFINTVAVADVIANSDLQNIMVTPIEQCLNLQAKFGVIATSQGKASLTFTAVTKPDVDIIYYVFVVGSEPVQDDIVVWSPKINIANSNNPPYYVAAKGVSSVSASRVFDNTADTLLTIANGQDIDKFYVRINKLNDDGSAAVPWVIYGLTMIFIKSDNYDNFPSSVTVYGTFNNINDVIEIITWDLESAKPIVEGNRYRYTLVFDQPYRYPSYVFSNFNNVLVDNGSILSDIYFLRSKADIIAEGGTV